MTDQELDAYLRSVRTPESAPDYWEWFPRRVMARVRAGDGSGAARWGSARRWRRLAWVGVLVFSSAPALLCWESPRPSSLRGVVVSVESFVQFPSDLRICPRAFGF